VLHSGNRLDIVTQAVVAGALVVAVLNAAAALVGGWRWYRCEDSGTFWVLLRVGQGSVLTLALVVGSLAAAGKYSSDSLFYLYALLPLAIGFVAEQLRVSSAQTILDQRELPDAQAVGGLAEEEQRRVVAEIMRRELGVMATAALVVVFLALRAAGTAHGF
jgi:hypothetical protein